MKRIKEWDAHTPLVLACRPGLGDVFLHFGLADEIVEIDKRRDGNQALDKLREREWDTLFVPHESVRTALWMRRLRARRRVGFQHWWNRFAYDRRVLKPQHLPDALRQLSLLVSVDDRLAEMFGSDEIQALSNVDSRKPVDYRTPSIPEWASMRMMTHQPERSVVFLAPGSVWATKRWTLKGYADLARLLRARGVEVELVGSRGEREICSEIASLVPGVVNSAGETTLVELVQKLNRGLALVSNDSGAMHAAAVADLPTVAVFGPTTLELGFRPWQNRAMVMQIELPCRPCGKHGHHKCPIGTHECMEKIPAGDVLKALDKLLEKV